MPEYLDYIDKPERWDKTPMFRIVNNQMCIPMRVMLSIMKALECREEVTRKFITEDGINPRERNERIDMHRTERETISDLQALIPMFRTCQELQSVGYFDY